MSENAEFAEACESAGIVFIGATPEQLRQFGLKHTAREIAQQNRVPMLPGSALLESLDQARGMANTIGYPVMLKSTAGGGGIGMQVCMSEAELSDCYEKVQRLSRSNFKQSGLFLEKYIQTARHIEVQIFGDGNGNVIALGERDCSTQRRNQKVIEETPAPGITNELRQELIDAAVRLGKAVSYRSAGTVEYVFDGEAQQFYFLEVNTRLQVEHGVTEAVSGVDLVEWMIRVAAGETEFLSAYQHRPQGHSVQVRIYAEDANKNFQPSSGLLNAVSFPDSIRLDAWIEAGTEVTPFYDPLLAKVIVQDVDRQAAIAHLQTALEQSTIAGIETNLDYLRQVISDARFQAGTISTKFLNSFEYKPNTIDVLEPGTYTTVQDYPGRIGYWDIGVPPSGPIDHFAFRLANQIVGNPESAAALECTATGSTLRFNCETTIALTGAMMKATLNGQSIEYWTAISIKAGDTLKLKGIQGNGYRTYIAFQNGLNVSEYLGSRSTFTLGKFGGHAGRTLRTGDVLHIQKNAGLHSPRQCSPELISHYKEQCANRWQIGVLYGPHGAPDFFTSEDIEMFFSTQWIIHHNSARTGIRLIGPKPNWARKDGGEAGLHPSNIHDNAYAIGTVDFTGDMPIILAHDGPSLGGFVCPATIVQAELWKIGQLKPGDTVQFYQLTATEARDRELAQDCAIANLTPLPKPAPLQVVEHSPILHQASDANQITVTYRQAGDRYLLVEYGDLVLDLNLRFCVHALVEWLRIQQIPGIIDLTPGIRSLQIHYDNRILPAQELLETLTKAELPSVDSIEVPTRIVHLPLSWNDESTQLAIQKYMQSVRSDAPWCPSNIEFIRRVNGLDSIEQVRETVFNASYLVLGLGDVYLGAPVATPLDPRHRLVTTKYNPARTWTPENAVGIGGAYMCIYGMEGPGGYQFVGRTVPIWNRYKQTADFTQPWLLRFFDQIRYYPVSAEQLLHDREALIQGKLKLRIEEETFSLKQYNQFLNSNADGIAAFRTQQRTAFQAERDRWAAAGEFTRQETLEVAQTDQVETSDIVLPPNSEAVVAHVSANVWQVLVKSGDVVAEGDCLIILEAMKMEIAMVADTAGVIAELFCTQGQTVSAGQVLLAIEPS